MIKRTLEQRIARLERLLKNEAASVDGATLIYNDNIWDVYRITSYSAAVFLGRGTEWGISGKWDDDSYQANRVEDGEEYYDKLARKLDGGFYFYIKKGSKIKYCLARKPNGTAAWIIDDENDDIKPKDILIDEPDFPSIEGVFVPKAPRKKAQTAASFIKAIADGDASKVSKLLSQGADPNEPDRYGAYPLITAIYNGHYEIAKMLLEAGADPNHPIAGKRAMSQAVGELKMRKDGRFVDLLVEYGSTQPQVW